MAVEQRCCVVEDGERCERTTRRGGRGMCRKHYMRWYNRGGDPSAREKPGVKGAKYGLCREDGCDYAAMRPGGPCTKHQPRKVYNPEVCTVDGCDKPAKTRGWCSAHYWRWKRYGDPRGSHEWEITYSTVHGRLRKQRGSAADSACVDCGKPAAEWSYVKGCSEERKGDYGGPYCVHPEHYEPRCKPCHSEYDRWW